MRRRLGFVFPPGWTIAVWVVLFAVFEGSVLIWEWRLGQRIVDVPVRPGFILLRFACLAYGAFRVCAWHPFYRSGYRKWLESTPWTAAKPLPLGPVHLVWQDGLVLGAILGLGFFQVGLNPLTLVPWFLGGYLGCLVITFRMTNAWGFDYAVLFGLGLMVRLAYQLPACLAVGLLTYLIAHLGLRRSLACFPWSLDWYIELGQRHLQLPAANPASRGFKYGWPFERLRPKMREGLGITPLDALLTSLLFGWWLYALSTLVTKADDRLSFLHLGHGVVLSFLIAVRGLTYCWGHLPPINLRGRLGTRRWIIPGYDKVLVAPLCTAIVGAAVPLFLAWWSVPPDVHLPLSLTLACLPTFMMGPTLLSWQLTGEHRLVPALNAKEYLKVG